MSEAAEAVPGAAATLNGNVAAEAAKQRNVPSRADAAALRRLGRQSKVSRAGPGGNDLSRLQVGLSLLLWPLALGLKVANAFLMLSLGGTRARLQSSPMWLVSFLSLPLRLLNPPVVLGARHLEALAKHRATAATIPAATEQQRADTSDETPLLSEHVNADTSSGAANGADGAAGDGAAAAPAPVMLVGNHTLHGLDHLPLLHAVHRSTGVCPSTLYEAGLDGIPLWTLFAECLGGVRGTTGRCGELMEAGKWQLLYPGGGDTDRTQLKWNASMGFVRMAIKYGAVVVPFASLGLEDSLHSIGMLDVGWWLRALEFSSPELRLPLLLPLNGMQRQYFAFGAPIPTAGYGGDWENNDKCMELYEEVRQAVQHLLAALHKVQARDPNRYPGLRIARRLLSILGAIKSFDAAVTEADSAL